MWKNVFLCPFPLKSENEQKLFLPYFPVFITWNLPITHLILIRWVTFEEIYTFIVKPPNELITYSYMKAFKYLLCFLTFTTKRFGILNIPGFPFFSKNLVEDIEWDLCLRKSTTCRKSAWQYSLFMSIKTLSDPDWTGTWRNA